MDEGPGATILINGIVADLHGETLIGATGLPIFLRPQTFATLRYLLRNANRLVTKTELMEAIWPGTAVTDDSLVQCVHEIRRALNDGTHSVLQTVSRRGYRLVLATTPGPGSVRRASIAVLPFTNLDDAPGQAYFADGLVEDLIIHLSKISGLFVIARNSSFQFRGAATDARRIAADLGVRYLLGGSLRRAGDRLRITAHLIDGETAAQVWADRFEGAAADVFDLQDTMTEQIVGVIEPTIRRAEVTRARAKRPDSLDAYDLFLRALPHAQANSGTEVNKALQLLAESLALDPDYMPSHGYAAWCHEQRYLRHGFDPADRAAALRHADIALGVNAGDPLAMSIAAFVRANLTRDYDGAIEVLDRALAMNGNSALAFGFSALISAHSERDARATQHARTALRLSPLDDPMNYHPWCALTLTSLFAGRYAEAVEFGNMTIRSNPGFSVAYAYLVVAHVRLGNQIAARTVANRLLEVAPGFSVTAFARKDLYRPPLMAGLVAALREAEMPEG